MKNWNSNSNQTENLFHKMLLHTRKIMGKQFCLAKAMKLAVGYWRLHPLGWPLQSQAAPFLQSQTTPRKPLTLFQWLQLNEKSYTKRWRSKNEVDWNICRMARRAFEDFRLFYTGRLLTIWSARQPRLLAYALTWLRRTCPTPGQGPLGKEPVASIATKWFCRQMGGVVVVESGLG